MAGCEPESRDSESQGLGTSRAHAAVMEKAGRKQAYNFWCQQLNIPVAESTETKDSKGRRTGQLAAGKETSKLEILVPKTQCDEASAGGVRWIGQAIKQEEVQEIVMALLGVRW